MPDLTITVSNVHDDDLDWIRTRAVMAVENAVSEAEDEGRLDGPAPDVSWEVDDET